MGLRASRAAACARRRGCACNPFESNRLRERVFCRTRDAARDRSGPSRSSARRFCLPQSGHPHPHPAAPRTVLQRPGRPEQSVRSAVQSALMAGLPAHFRSAQARALSHVEGAMSPASGGRRPPRQRSKTHRGCTCMVAQSRARNRDALRAEASARGALRARVRYAGIAGGMRGRSGGMARHTGVEGADGRARGVSCVRGVIPRARLGRGRASGRTCARGRCGRRCPRRG